MQVYGRNKLRSAIKWWLWRFFVPKFVDVDLGSLELFENVTGVRFYGM